MTSPSLIPHPIASEGGRLRLMASLLDGISRRHIDALGIAAGWQVWTDGCDFTAVKAEAAQP